MAKAYTLQQVVDLLAKTRDKEKLSENFNLVSAALSRYADQDAYNDADNAKWLSIAKLVTKKYDISSLSQKIQDNIKRIQARAQGQEAVKESRKKGSAKGLESLQALLDAKNTEAKPSENIPEFTFSLEKEPARAQDETKTNVQNVSVTESKGEKAPEASSVDEKTPAPTDGTEKTDAERNNEEVSDKLPPVPVKKINKKANAYFAKAKDASLEEKEQQELRRQGFGIMTQECEEYFSKHSCNENNLSSLSCSDLFFLYRHLSYSEHANAEQMLGLLDEALFGKITDDLQNMMDDGQYIPEKDQQAALKYLEYIRKKLSEEKRTYSQKLLAESADSYIKSLTEYQSPRPQKEKRVRISQVSSPKEFEHLNINEINAEAEPHFEEAKKYGKASDEAKKHRREGNKAITSACVAYINQHLQTEENWDQLSLRELVYLHKNIRMDYKRNNLAKTLAEKCDKKLKAFEAKITAEENVAAEDIVALKDFCRYRVKDLEKRADEESIAQVATYKSALFKLDRAEKKQKGSVDITKPQQEEKHPKQTPALAQAFEKACEKENIRYVKNEQEVIEYDLFSPNAPAEAEPSGKLSIASETDVTLQSEEFKHFLALAQAVKESGGTQIDLGTLSPDPQEAQKFVALMVLAGYKAKIKVNFPDTYSMKDLAKVNPEIEKMQKIKRFKAEINKLQKQGEKSPEAKQKFREKQVEYFRYLLEHGDVCDTRSKEDRQKYFEERINKTLGKKQAQEPSAPKKDNSAPNSAVATAVREQATATR